MKKLLVVMLSIVMILTLFSGGVFAAGDYGSPGEFLTWGAGARSLGMGKAFTGLADDASAVVYNPGGLAQQNPFQFTFMHILLYEDTMYDFGAITLPFSGVGTFAVGYVRLGSTGFDGRSETWENLGEFDVSSQGVILSYARDIIGGLAVGVSAKMVMEEVYDKSEMGFGADFGILYSPIEYVSVGLSVLNLVPPSVTLDIEPDVFPMIIKFGVAGKFLGERIIPVIDVEQELGGKDLKIRFGLEVLPLDFLAIRLGHDETDYLTVGLGAKFLRNYKFDYSFAMQELGSEVGILGMTHRASLTISFGGFDVNLSALPKIFSPVGTRKTTKVTIYASTKYPIDEWELNIINEGNDVVRTYSGSDNPPDSVLWDGKDDRGLPVSDGEFKCVMKVIDKNGKEISSAGESVKISSSLPMQPGTIELEE